MSDPERDSTILVRAFPGSLVDYNRYYQTGLDESVVDTQAGVDASGLDAEFYEQLITDNQQGEA